MYLIFNRQADQARQVFAQSNLSATILNHVWKLSDIHKHGKLNMDEFAVAMYLIYAKLAGKDLPVTLPPELVPPSTRELDALTSFIKNDVLASLNAPKRTIARDFSAANIDISPVNSESSRPQISSIIPTISAQEQLDKRDQLLKAIETKRAELFNLEEKVKIQSRSARNTELEFLKTKTDISSLHNDIVQSLRLIDQYTSSVENARLVLMQSGQATCSQLKAAANNLEKEIFESLEKANKVIEGRAEKKIQDVKKKYPAQFSGNLPKVVSSSGPSVDSVASKASAMLAARMAALGVGMGNESSQGVYEAEINKINEEKEYQQNLLRDREFRIRSILREFQFLAGKPNIEKENIPKAVGPSIDDQIKFEDGKGIISSEVQSFILNLKNISMHSKRNAPLPMIPIKLLNASSDSTGGGTGIIQKGSAIINVPIMIENSLNSVLHLNIKTSKPESDSSYIQSQRTSVAEGLQQYQHSIAEKSFDLASSNSKSGSVLLGIRHSDRSSPGISIVSSSASSKPRSSFEIKHAEMLHRAQEAMKIAQEGVSRRRDSSINASTNILAKSDETSVSEYTYESHQINDAARKTLDLQRNDYTALEKKQGLVQEPTPLSPPCPLADFSSSQNAPPRDGPKSFSAHSIIPSPNMVCLIRT